VIVFIVFARERLRRSQVERFTSRISLFDGETFEAERSSPETTRRAWTADRRARFGMENSITEHLRDGRVT
jgi:hypothetical protein